jgi:SAM-dependent methyltransferase
MLDDDPWGPEISDVIVDYEPETLARRAVPRDAAIERLRSRGRRRAARIAEALPHVGGVFDADGIDRVLIEAHLELQRLHEEFANGWRVRLLLEALVATMRERTPGSPVRVVDVGCGLGYVVRWLAAEGALGPDTELLGVDYNAALIAGARVLARREGLSPRFEVANAFALDRPATIYVSSGVLHHFRGDGLARFFEEQVAAGARAFVHLDVKPTWNAPIGAWLFHQARMTVPLARWDGTASALRAHSKRRLEDAMAKGAPSLARAFFDAKASPWTVARVMHAAVGLERELYEPFLARLGTAAGRLQRCAP